MPLSNYPNNGEIYYETIKEKKFDFMSTYDYCWRWDADSFWGISGISFLRNKWIRKIFGRIILNGHVLKTMQKILKLMNIIKQDPNKERVVQDLGVPHENVNEFYNWINDQESFSIYPLWICPVKPKESDTYLWSYNKDKLYFDIGVFGSYKSNKAKSFDFNKRIEKKLLELDGNKCFYSDTFFDYDDFKKLINIDKFKEIKNKYDNEYKFGDLYTKVIDKSVLKQKIDKIKQL